MYKNKRNQFFAETTVGEFILIGSIIVFMMLLLFVN